MAKPALDPIPTYAELLERGKKPDYDKILTYLKENGRNANAKLTTVQDHGEGIALYHGGERIYLSEGPRIVNFDKDGFDFDVERQRKVAKILRDNGADLLELSAEPPKELTMD